MGVLYPIDINPYAIERIETKKEREGLTNLIPKCANVSNTGLEDQSVDMVFMFGLPHIVGGLEKVLLEMGRILIPTGILLFNKAGRTEKNFIEVFGKAELSLSERKKGILVFTKDSKN